MCFILHKPIYLLIIIRIMHINLKPYFQYLKDTIYISRYYWHLPIRYYRWGEDCKQSCFVCVCYPGIVVLRLLDTHTYASNGQQLPFLIRGRWKMVVERILGPIDSKAHRWFESFSYKLLNLRNVIVFRLLMSCWSIDTKLAFEKNTTFN